MQQVFSNLQTRTETHVWEISGNPVSPVGANHLNAPFFLNLCHPGDLSATICFADFLLSIEILSSFYQGCDISSGCHQVVKFHKVFTKFSSSFHQVFTWFFNKFSPSFLNRFSLGFHPFFTVFLN